MTVSEPLILACPVCARAIDVGLADTTQHAPWCPAPQYVGGNPLAPWPGQGGAPACQRPSCNHWYASHGVKVGEPVRHPPCQVEGCGCAAFVYRPEDQAVIERTR